MLKVKRLMPYESRLTPHVSRFTSNAKIIEYFIFLGIQLLKFKIIQIG